MAFRILAVRSPLTWRMASASSAEDHGAKHIAVFGHADDVLSGVGEVDGALPPHNAEDVCTKQA